MPKLLIRETLASDLEQIQAFTDKQIGQGYYKTTELKDILLRSCKDDVNCSFLLMDDDQIAGIRLSFPPGQWSKGKGQGLTPNLWPHPLEQTAYFQSLFIDPQYQGKGWGRQLSERSLEKLIQLGSRGVLCHSWKESPDNTSSQYLKSIGFRSIAQHPHYWSSVPYQCTRCAGTCECTALEMYLDLASC